MWDAIKNILTSIAPPRDIDPERVYQWRVTVAMLVVAIGAVSMINALLLFGFVPAFFAGLVPVNSQALLELQRSQKTDLASISAQISGFANALIASQVATLNQQMYNLRIMQCNALKSGNREAARSHGQQLQELAAQFRNLAHYDYALRPCAEL